MQRSAISLLIFLIGCSTAGKEEPLRQKSQLIPLPGSSYRFAWTDIDSLGREVNRSRDTMVFTVLDTGLSMAGRTGVVALSWFVGDTIFLSYDQPDELQLASTKNHWWSWDGWSTMPQLCVSLADLPNGKAEPEVAAWYAPEIGFFVRFANYEHHDGRRELRVNKLLSYSLK